MEIKLQNTTKIVHINGVPARIWEGHTAKGVRILAFITRVAVPDGEDASELERELQETPPVTPEMGQVFDPRLVL